MFNLAYVNYSHFLYFNSYLIRISVVLFISLSNWLKIKRYSKAKYVKERKKGYKDKRNQIEYSSNEETK